MKLKKILSFAAATAISATMFIVSAGAADAPKSGVITGNGVRLRSGPGTGYSILDHYYKGDELSVVTPGESWVKVSDNGKTGYVSKTYFTYLTEKEEKLSAESKAKSDAEVEVKRSDVVAYAKKFLGVRYVWGGSSPSGFDCSGFTQYVYDHFDLDIPRTASQQYAATKNSHISRSELQPGDLVYFDSPSTSSVAHVGIYVGDGKFIHSNSPGGSVRITALSTSYYKTHYVGASSMN